MTLELARRALFLLIPLLAVACGSPAERPRNLILISLDTVRADFLSSYGYPKPTSPTLDAIASEGTLFEQAYATSPWTLPSHASLLTGSYASRHGANHQGRLRDEVPHLAAILNEHGYETRAFVNSLYLSKRFGVTDAFVRSQWLRESQTQRGASKVGEEAISWLADRNKPEPFFLFLHYYDAHSDYVSDERYEREFVAPYEGEVDGSTRQLLLWREKEFDLDETDLEQLRQRYAAGIRQLDDSLAKLFDFLREARLLEDSLIVIVSDHGEEFLEHGDVLHGRTQHEELVRIPMIFRGPGVPAGLRVTGPVSLIDVAPTSLRLLGLPLPEGFDGIDLSPLSATSVPERFVFFEEDHVRKEVGPNRAVTDGRYKLHRNLSTGAEQLFDLRPDPFESRPLEDSGADIRNILSRQLDGFLEAGSASSDAPELDAEEREHLRALGYLE